MDAWEAGAAIAARSLGYRGLANIIVEERLGPEQIARLFANSASKNGARDRIIILTAGGNARFRAHPRGWSGEIERRLAQEAMTRQGMHLQFGQLSGRAAAMVNERWPEIEQAARGG